MNLKAIVVASVQGTDLSLHDLLHSLKVKGRLQSLLMEAILDKIIAQAIVQQGLEVSTAELQKAADAFRTRLSLHKTADLQRWLADRHLSPEDWERELERTLLTEKLADKVVPPEAVAKHFAENRTRLDRARLAHLVVEKEGLANELFSQLQEDEADFAALARTHSLDEPTRSHGGQLGVVPRQQLSPAVAQAVFQARQGDVVGPFKNGRGYQVFKVEEVFPGQLDASAAAAIRQTLFRQWVQAQAQAAKVQIKLYEQL
jgi:peptidylprolyl isomerase